MERGRNQGNQFKDPAEPVHGHLPDPRIDRPRTQVQEGGVKSHGKPRIGKPVRRLPEIDRLKTVEIAMIETDLRIDPLPDDHRQQIFPEEVERHMNLDFFQYLTHADLT